MSKNKLMEELVRATRGMNEAREASHEAIRKRIRAYDDLAKEMEPGEEITYTDPDGREYKAVAKEVRSLGMTVLNFEDLSQHREPPKFGDTSYTKKRSRR